MKTEKRGGARVGAGRKKRSEEEQLLLKRTRQQICTDELIVPSIIAALRASPNADKFGATLTIRLSKTDIRTVYGEDGVKLFTDRFKQDRRGGTDRFGNGYKTTWSIPFKDIFLCQGLLRQVGVDPKNLPEVECPSLEMQHRLDEIHLRRYKRHVSH